MVLVVQLLVAALFVAGILLFVRAKIASRRAPQRAAPAPLAREKRAPRPAPEVPTPAPPAESPSQTTPERAAKPSPELIREASPSAWKAPDLTHLEGAPEGAGCQLECGGSAEVEESVLKQAREISEHLADRLSVLNQLSRAPVEPQALTEVIRSQPLLAGHVLRAVNSPYYGLRAPVASVFRAVLLLGHVEIRNIIWRFCINDALDIGKQPTQDILQELWQHCAASSQVAYAIAKSFGMSAPDEIATAALLHDAGKLICLTVHPDHGRELYQPIRFSTHEGLQAEAELGMRHTYLGGEVVRLWGLPAETCQTIAQHHAPSYYGPDEIEGDKGAILAVHLADVLCHLMKDQGAATRMPIYRPPAGWLDRLGIAGNLEGIFTELVVKAFQKYAQPADEESAAA